MVRHQICHKKLFADFLFKLLISHKKELSTSLVGSQNKRFINKETDLLPFIIQLLSLFYFSH